MTKCKSVGDFVLMSEACRSDVPAKYRPSQFGIIVSVQRHPQFSSYAILDVSRDIKLPWYGNSVSVKSDVENIPQSIQEELESRLFQYKKSDYDPWFYSRRAIWINDRCYKSPNTFVSWF